MISADLKRQLAIKGWILGILALGFVVAIAIPRLAIMRLGEVGYGVYALILGFSGILAFADLGLEPGLIRGLARPIAMGDREELNGRLKAFDRIAFGVSLLLVAGCTLLMCWSLSAFKWNTFYPLIVFAAATFVYIIADLRASLLRLSGEVTVSYVFRGVYLVTNLSAVVVLYYSVKVWDGVWPLCSAQLLASCIYYACVKVCLSRRCNALHPRVAGLPRAPETKAKFWSEARRVSSPERLNRAIQLTMGAIERPLLIATAGLAMVTSYDLLMRLVLLVSAVPGALNDPLLAMLAHDSVRESRDRKFPLALRLTKIASLVCAVVGLITCIVLWAGFHHMLFGVSSRIPLVIGVLVAVVAAINIQTAPESAALIAEGIVWPINAKLYTEAVGIILGGLIAWWLRNGLLFIAIRYCALGLSATGFLLLGTKFGRVAREQEKEACCVGHQLERGRGYS